MMPIFLLGFGLGAGGALWVSGSAEKALKWAAIGGAVYVAGKAIKVI